MFAIPWYVVLFVSIPESYLIFILGFALYNLEIKFSQALAVSIIESIIIYFVRQMDLVFGIHTIVAIGVSVVLLTLLVKLPIKSVLMITLTGFVLMAILQCSILPAGILLTSLDPQEFAFRPWLNIAFFAPEAIIMGILYNIVRKYHLYVVDLKAGEKDVPDD